MAADFRMSGPNQPFGCRFLTVKQKGSALSQAFSVLLVTA
jgi:hypothetical protein